MESNYTSLMNEISKLKSDNESLKTQLSINKNIIQELLKKNYTNDKMPTLLANIQKENNLLQSQIEKIQKENIVKKADKNSNKNQNDIEIYECKLFVYENMLKEKQNIIVSLKDQIKNMKSNFLSNFKDIKNINNSDELNLKNSPITTNDININENDNNDNNIKDKFVLEEICVIPPDKALNTLNSKIELYKSVNIKLKKIIKDLKETLTKKDNEYLTLEENLLKTQKELEKYSRNKNNEEVINKLIQYQSMKKLPISQSCSNFNMQEKNYYFDEKNKKKLNNAKSSAYLCNKKIYKEIENFENLNKKLKEITDENLVLNEGWEETLKYCNMTQEEFSKYYKMKSNSKLASAVEYLYTILIDKNIQIKLLTQENEALNEENIRLNKVNIELESSINFNNIKIHKSRNKKINNNILFQNNENLLYKTYKNYFLNAPPSPNKNTKINDKEMQKAFVNVDNNITHTNININMMMDCDYKKKFNHKNNFNSLASGEFCDGMLLDDMSDFNTNTNLKIITEPDIPQTLFKKNNNDKAFKTSFKKINSKSQSKLILNKKQFRNKTPYNYKKKNLSLKNFSPGKNVTSDSNNNNKLEYNTIINNIFNKTDKTLTQQSINVIKKNNNNKKQLLKFHGFHLPKKKEEINSNIDSNVVSNINSNLNTLKLYHNREKYKTNLTNSNNNGIKKINNYNNSKNDNNKAFEVFRKYIKEYTKNSQNKVKAK